MQKYCDLVPVLKIILAVGGTRKKQENQGKDPFFTSIVQSWNQSLWFWGANPTRVMTSLEWKLGLAEQPSSPPPVLFIVICYYLQFTSIFDSSKILLSWRIKVFKRKSLSVILGTTVVVLRGPGLPPRTLLPTDSSVLCPGDAQVSLGSCLAVLGIKHWILLC